MVKGDLKQMSSNYLRGAKFHDYGTTLYVGVGIPIPLINMNVAASAALKDSDINTSMLDYGIPSRNRPSVKEVEVDGKAVKTLTMSLLGAYCPDEKFKRAEEEYVEPEETSASDGKGVDEAW